MNQIGLKTNDKRKVQFYWAMCCLHLKCPELIQPNSTEKTLDAIEDLITKNPSSFRNKDEFIKKLIHDEECYLLRNEDIEWIDIENKKLIDWMWGIIVKNPSQQRMIDYLSSTPPTLEQNTSQENMNIITMYSIPRDPQSTKEKQSLIIKVLDLIQTHFSSKRQILELYKMSWRQVQSSNLLTWIKKEDDIQVKWALKYICESKNGITIPLINDTPLNRNESYDYIIMKIDTWQVYSDTKELFIIKMKKAWSQKKHRDKLDGKKPCSFNLSQATKDQLDYLSKSSGKHKNEIIEELINTEHQQVNNK